jgi:tetratricopeptide (TPR) repeat protein
MKSMSATEKEYRVHISTADSAFRSNNYVFAKDQYESASKLINDSVYPKERIAEIEKIIEEGSAEAIRKGDKAFAEKDYTSAIKEYTLALTLKDDTDTKNKLNSIQNILNTNGSMQKYKVLIAKADAAFGKEDFTSARMAYLEASNLRPTAEEPKRKIAEIDSDSLIAVAMNKGANKDYSNALTDLDSAKALMPDKAAYIDQQIKYIKEQLEKDQKYVFKNFLTYLTVFI